MSNILDTVQISGSSYDLKDKNAAGVSGVTQAEYDALVSGGTVDPNMFYIITDATAADLSNYYTSAQTESAINAAVSGKVDASSITSAVTSASTDNEIPTAKAVYDAIPTGGTGGSYSAGTNISIADDTISCTLPISAKTSNLLFTDKSIMNGLGYYSAFNPIPENYYFNSNLFISTQSSSNYSTYLTNSIIVGDNGYTGTTDAWGSGTGGGIIVGRNNKVKKSRLFNVFGNSNSGETAGYNDPIFIFGERNSVNKTHSSAFGLYNKTTNNSEQASGQYNNSVSASTTFGDSGNTLFSVGNGTADNARHNAFEIRQNGDIYFTLNGSDVKLQDQFGSTIEVSSAITSGDTNAVSGGAVYEKLDEIEQVVARALNDLNNRITAIENQLSNS